MSTSGLGGYGGRRLAEKLGPLNAWSFALQRLSAIEESQAARRLEELGYDSLDDFLVRYWDGLYEKRDANNIMAMTATWIANDISANEVFAGDIGAALSAITATTVLMPCATDLYFTTEDARAELAHLQRGSLVEIPSHWGHMAGAGQSKDATAFIDAELQRLLSSD